MTENRKLAPLRHRDRDEDRDEDRDKDKDKDKEGSIARPERTGFGNLKLNRVSNISLTAPFPLARIKNGGPRCGPP
ncbi:MAG: hypothetical protein COB04_02530 [Gammaproteobacteria bacterium]|nr:MAG: hypothetical protein COB04_02530 [Gammaproteobacteria bacterium]